jgi:hypothetical protein
MKGRPPLEPRIKALEAQMSQIADYDVGIDEMVLKDPRIAALEGRMAEIESQLALFKPMLDGKPPDQFVTRDRVAAAQQYKAQFDRWPGNGG